MDLITLALSKKITSDVIEAKADKTDIVQSDWNQNDETSLDYIKNRPFYEGEPVENIVLPEIVVEDTSSLEYGMWTLAAVCIEVGETYEVLYNDEIYTVECYEGDIGPSIGDVNTQEYPFYMFDGGWATMLKFIPQTEPLKFCIKSYTSPIKKLERKFIEGIVGKDVEGKVFEYDGKQYTAQRYAEIFNDHDNVAVGYASHAEGYATKALGTDSHAEGYGTVTKGQASHAEGSYTIASGAVSHSEGSRTIASSDYQHVQGKYNIEDTEGKYAHIVGNGENTHNEGEKRSNAHTLDWSGNAEFAGDVKVNACGGENPISLIALAEEVAKLKELMSNGLAGQFAVSDGNGGINWITLCKAEEVEY